MLRETFNREGETSIPVIRDEAYFFADRNFTSTHSRSGQWSGKEATDGLDELDTIRL